MNGTTLFLAAVAVFTVVMISTASSRAAFVAAHHEETRTYAASMGETLRSI